MVEAPAFGQTRRVLIVNRVGHLGGVERVILTLASALPSCDWQPIVACPVGGDFAEEAQIQGTTLAPCSFDRMRITASPRVWVRYPAALARGRDELADHCRRLGIDLLHVHHPVTALYASAASHRLGIPMILHVHETLPARPLYSLALRLAIKRAALVLCVSRAALRLALTRGADPARSRVVYNGVDPRFLADQTGQPQLPAIGPMDAGPHIGIFGVLEPRKAQHLLLDAASKLVERFPGARFWLVGPAALGDKQAYVDSLHQMAETSALRGKVVFAGFQANVAAWLSAMDVVVQTSVALESFGMAIAEAMALGRPVIVSDVGGLPEVVRDERSGLVVPSEDPEALAAALARLLSDPTLRASFGRAGALDVRERFAPAVFSRSVANAYDEVLNSASCVHGDRSGQ